MSQGFAFDAIVRPGYLFGGWVFFGSDGNFTKASYPDLKAIMVHLQGPGGAGGGAEATAAGQISIGGGGGAGGYLRKWLVVGDLATSETVVVPTGATGVSGAAGNNGVNTTNFGSHGFVVNGGAGGNVLTAGNTDGIAGPGTGSNSSGGDLHMRGQSGEIGVRIAATTGRGGAGGGGHWADGSSGRGTTGDGIGNSNQGGGGGGAVNGASQSARPGGNGGNALVVVELWY